MIPDEKVMCPYTGFSKTCLDGVVKHKCPKWMQVMGSNPQTGVEFNRWGCADSFVPLLLIENSQMQRQTGAAVESLRNVVAKNIALAVSETSNGKLINARNNRNK